MLSNNLILITSFLHYSLCASSARDHPCVSLYKCPMVLSDFKLGFEDPEYCDEDSVKCPKIEMSKSMKSESFFVVSKE